MRKTKLKLIVVKNTDEHKLGVYLKKIIVPNEVFTMRIDVLQRRPPSPFGPPPSPPPGFPSISPDYFDVKIIGKPTETDRAVQIETFFFLYRFFMAYRSVIALNNLRKQTDGIITEMKAVSNKFKKENQKSRK